MQYLPAAAGLATQHITAPTLTHLLLLGWCTQVAPVYALLAVPIACEPHPIEAIWTTMSGILIAHRISTISSETETHVGQVYLSFF